MGRELRVSGACQGGCFGSGGLSLCPVAWPGLEVDSLMRVNEEPSEPEPRLQGSRPSGARGQGWGIPNDP